MGVFRTIFCILHLFLATSFLFASSYIQEWKSGDLGYGGRGGAGTFFSDSDIDDDGIQEVFTYLLTNDTLSCIFNVWR